VSSSFGDDANAGTKEKPFKTLQHTVDVANGRPIYACAEEFKGSVVITSDNVLLGGFDCAHDWIGSTKNSSLLGDPDKPALTITKAGCHTTVSGFDVEAALPLKPGDSAIGIATEGC
jgi:hypothetical protein